MRRTDILAEASRLTSTERERTYGPPHINMSASDELKEVWRRRNSGRMTPVPKGYTVEQWADQVRCHNEAIEMVLTKIGRIATGQPHLDNYVDAAAYCAIAGEAITPMPPPSEANRQDTDRKVPRFDQPDVQQILSELGYAFLNDVSVTLNPAEVKTLVRYVEGLQLRTAR